MGFLKGLFFMVLMSLVFIFSGCGGASGGSNTDSNVTELSVVLPIATSEITSSNQIVSIEVRVFDKENRAYEGGLVNVTYPEDGVAGRDVGSFAVNSVGVVNGVATFNYTAPSDIGTNTSDIVFKFYHEDNPTKIASYTFTINPDQALLTNYSLESSDDNATMDLDSSRLITFSITDDNNVLVDDSKITSIKITSLNPNKGTVEDSLGHVGNSLTMTGKNSVPINVNSKTESGLIPLKVEANFLDASNNNQALTKIFNVLVLSGPPSAMSISSSTGASHEENRAKFIETFVLTVTDKYGNLVNTNPAVSMGLITGFTQASVGTATNGLNYLYVGTGTNGGTINPVTNRFTAKNDIFNNVDTLNDVLVTFGTNNDGYTYNASGKWDIISNTSDTLFLSDDYNGELTSNLGFVVGHNNRPVTCSTSGEEAVANVYPENNIAIVPATGSMVINIEYDYYLVGKTVILWVNLIRENHATSEVVKIGEAKKIGLLGTGLSVYNNGSNTYNVGDVGVVRIDIGVGDTTQYYRNGIFGYTIQAPDDLNWTVIGDSMDNSLNNCTANNNGGIGYVDVNITTPAPAAGEITFKSILPTIGGEF